MSFGKLQQKLHSNFGKDVTVAAPNLLKPWCCSELWNSPTQSVLEASNLAMVVLTFTVV